MSPEAHPSQAQSWRNRLTEPVTFLMVLAFVNMLGFAG
jgi:hypothetical protein